MKFFNSMSSINAFDTEAHSNTLKVICDAYGNYYENDNNPDNLLDWLFTYACDLNFLYNIDYDASIIFRAIMPEIDKEDNGIYHYKSYDIYYISNKSLMIKKHESKTKIRTVRIYDIAQFYKNEKGYQPLDTVAKEVLGIGKNNEELEINRQQIGEIEGYYEQNRENIIKYCKNDAYITMLLAKKKIQSIIPVLKGQIPKTYNSSASISKAYLSIFHVDLRYQYYRLLSQLPEYKKAVRIIENSYFGGIFYLHSLGKVSNVYEYDINSAYPYAITQLYNLTDAEIRYTNKYENADYGFYHVKIRNLSDLPIHYRTGATDITYIKSNDYVENYFTGAELDYFRKYHSKDIQFEIIEGIVINTKKKLEFPDYKKLYQKRNEIKQEMKEKKEIEKISGIKLGSLEDDMSQWSYKTVLNASYGCFAERKNGYTTFTNLIYASYITAITRIKIYEIIDKVGWKHIKAVMTDAVLTDTKIDDVNFNNNELGCFKLEGYFDTVWLYMNGIYISKIGNRITLHNRGFPSLTNSDDLFNAKGTKLRITRKMKVIKIKEGIIQHRKQDIGKFTTQQKELDLEANRWKYTLDVDKLKFEYLKDNELITDFSYNIELQFKYTEKPFEKPIDYKAIKDMLWRLKNWRIPEIKQYNIQKINYEAELNKIAIGEHRLRDFKRFYKRYSKNLDFNYKPINIESDSIICISNGLLFAV
ncbi:MAG: hypothetical protein M1327_06630 [Candidatus Thermoplasmatota archaeon]|nr:hypothetical protein [Candidatus Thermoplasmatota archaeon]